MAGALLQILLRNPLADPYVLGVSGGAASFALGAMMLSLPTLYINLCAFAGALAAIMILLFATRRTWLQGASHVASSRLLLTGVVPSNGLGRIDYPFNDTSTGACLAWHGVLAGRRFE